MALNSLVSRVKGSPLTYQPMPVLRTMHGSTCEIYPDESTSRFARIFEATTDVVAMADRSGRLLYLNAAGRQLRKLEQDAEISEITIRDLHPAWAFEILAEEGLPSANADGSWSGETALVSATGRECPVIEVVLAHFGEDRQVDFISLICRDISERKLKELEQIEWANRYNAAIRASGQVVFDWNTLSGEIAYGGEVENLLGFSTTEMSGGIGRLRQLIHPGDVASFDERIEMAKILRDPFEHTCRVIRKGGGEIVVQAQGCFFLDRQGHLGRMMGFLKDVTKERMAERAIHLANERLEQRVVERTGELAKANIELKKSALRQAAISRLGQRALAGQSLGELMLDAAKTVLEMLPCDRTSVLQYDENEDNFRPLAEVGWPNNGPERFPIFGGTRSMSGYALQTGQAVVSGDMEKETRFAYSEGSRASGVKSGIATCIKVGERPLGVFLSFSLRPREFSREDVAFVQSIANVLTTAIDRQQADENIRRARADAESANRAKSEFLSRMSHELRTPLNAILGFTQLLEMEEHTAKQSESIGHISRAGRNLLDLINEVLDIARLDAGRVEFHMEPVDVPELLREAVTCSSLAASKRKIALRIAEVPGEAPFVSSDRERLKQVLLNLISNGVKFNRDRGSVVLTLAQANPGMLRISITDTGIGIPQEKLTRLFVPFERLGTREGGIEGGTGLGLALCQRLITGLGGHIGVASTVGMGSTFWVDVPVAEKSAEAPGADPGISAGVPPSTAAPETKVRTVLYIEDDAANFFLLDRFLSTRKDIKLISALQGSIGLDLAREHHPALILLDLNLPDMNGEQVLRKLKADPATADLRVVVVSGDITGGKDKELAALGVAETLAKPYNLTQITAVLERALALKT